MVWQSNSANDLFGSADVNSISGCQYTADGTWTPLNVRYDSIGEITLQYEDIAVEYIGNGVKEDGKYLVYADIVNRGYGVQSGITVSLYQDAVPDSPCQ